MAILFLILPIILLFLHVLHRRRCCRTPLLIDWPILGMLPQVLSNLCHIHDFATNVLRQKGGTGEFMGPWFTKVNYMVTSDPMNVHHIMSKCFDNYVKGPEFREIFQAFGDGIVTADSESWRYLRTMHHFLLRQQSFETTVEKTFQEKVQNSLLPILDHAWLHGNVLDLQDVFSRLMFDETCIMVLGYDPKSLSIEFPLVEVEKAFDEFEESIFYRHIVPRSVWKFQEWLQIGEERKMTKACKVFDQFLYSCIATKRQELHECNKSSGDDLLGAMMMMGEEKGKMVHDDKFLRDAAFNLFVAGRDTITSALTWFFWLVATHPLVEAKILEEIEKVFGADVGKKREILGMEDVKKLVYLHGALCEGLRLFPPVPIERKQSLKRDTLPSGHCVNPNSIILLFTYAMGRFEEIWGKDCLEFKPERWISEKGETIHVPSYKFISFNAGPRTCLGKDLSFFQMKMVASTILRNYRIQVVENHPTIPAHSIVLLMKHGLKVMITKRQF
ncbi:alkane hydroxylase MAH1-like [Arachis stenosperma]|uniref:alkane hydroxylase MAH1-like n=1 Tax=Arachis stenosperma TaxID=217475 RepID=UPI0025ACB655|nr:alkane hydroxylase MAH1-like [Arachis stenosperma]